MKLIKHLQKIIVSEGFDHNGMMITAYLEYTGKDLVVSNRLDYMFAEPNECPDRECEIKSVK